MLNFRIQSLIVTSFVIVVFSCTAFAQEEHDHYDIAPYLIDGQLITGGLDHDGNVTSPPITVYGFEFEDTYDPYNPSDPGVNQAAGTGNLPSGAAVNYNITSSLLYWDGVGEVTFGSPGDAYIDLLMGSSTRTLNATSGEQAGAYIQAVASDGSLHKHFTTSLYAAADTSNVPGESGYVAPDNGIYAFSIELTLVDGATTYTSETLWMVFNSGMSEEVHEAAMDYFQSVPEPVSLTLLAAGGVFLLKRKRG